MNRNIIYYDWVPFFGAICEKILEFTLEPATQEKKLIEAASKTFQPDHAILKYSTIDPFSYIYALAQRSTKNQRKDTFTKAKDAFGLDVEIPTDYIFPTPTPNTLSLFYSKGNYINKDGNTVGNECLWKLFVQIFQDERIDENDFGKVLSIKNVGFTKMSQAMFLINPIKYIPFDTQMNSLPVPDLADLKQVVSKIDQAGFSFYLDLIKKLQNAFSGCELYEINLLNVLINSRDRDQLKVSNKYCQISSWADGQEDSDYFSDFVSQNAVWTGGSAGRTGARVYPLTDFDRGDIVLVRRGTKWLGGIAIVVNNEYLPDGYSDESKIQIVWLVKQNKKIEGTGLGQWDGFSNASDNTIQKFRELYPRTFSFLDSIRTIQKVMINHSEQKYKNLILQGPPGTGKTRLAKQIAEWLTNDEEKSNSLIEAIDKQIFQKEPEVEDNEQIKLIQFHPSYTYEDFVRGIRVGTEGEKIKYDVENRIFASFAEEAAKTENQDKAYVLIIDEINRANLTSVLGELIYALEYRGNNVSSLYKLKDGDHEIMLPHNLYIIGTMNTADRSVSHIDYAIRRRFTFIPVPSHDLAIIHDKAKSLYAAIKQIFDEHTSPEFDQNDIQIGHSYFLVNDDEIGMKLKYEIKPLLLEYIKDGVLLESARTKVKDLNA
ncbi:AAA family ATPase [Altibacter sp.]|uniref:McrB family protein n=1 Tax=Altibacter sp. TaxID=2024823 RepID=UPI0025C5D893|nr:AAA family ATPase [Altibacter sp.]